MSEPIPDFEATQLLIKQAAAGDIEAFNALYARYEWLSRSLHRARKGSTQSNESDLLDSTYAHVLRSVKISDIANIESESQFRNWLILLIRQEAIEKARRNRANRHGLFQGFLNEDDGDGSGVGRKDGRGTIGATGENLETLAVLQRLPKELKEVVLLRFFENLTWEEIADILGHEVRTVRRFSNEARSRLRELIAQSSAILNKGSSKDLVREDLAPVEQMTYRSESTLELEVHKIRRLLTTNDVHLVGSGVETLQEDLLKPQSRSKPILEAGFHKLVILDVQSGIAANGQFDLARFQQYCRDKLIRSFHLKVSQVDFHFEQIRQILRDEQQQSLLCFLRFELIPAQSRNRLRGLTQELHRSLLCQSRESD